MLCKKLKYKKILGSLKRFPINKNSLKNRLKSIFIKTESVINFIKETKMYRNDERDLRDPLNNNQQQSIQSFDTH